MPGDPAEPVLGSGRRGRAVTRVAPVLPAQLAPREVEPGSEFQEVWRQGGRRDGPEA